MYDFLSKELVHLESITPQKSALLGAELKLQTIDDLLNFYPFKYLDKTRFYTAKEITEADNVFEAQIIGSIESIKFINTNHSAKRLICRFVDNMNGVIELVWFKNIVNIKSMLEKYADKKIIAYGNIETFQNKISIIHPIIKQYNIQHHESYLQLEPQYSSTSTLKQNKVSSILIRRALLEILKKLKQIQKESLPETIVSELKLVSLFEAMANVHFPKSQDDIKQAQRRLKFEELFFNQINFGLRKIISHSNKNGILLKKEFDITKRFTSTLLPFKLTNAQKKSLKEIHSDMTSGNQMNRLLQGDVGSGKTIVAFIAILMCIDNGYQTAIMAPTEILATQHYNQFRKYSDMLDINVELIKGSLTEKKRAPILEDLKNGALEIIVGTHALIEDAVQFKKLGLLIIDEQHRFGVAQREKLWKKNETEAPHVLVMSATPIPRTLAMTLYGDLDLSNIDELPPGRTAIETFHYILGYEKNMYNHISRELEIGRQAYFVYPLIEESTKMDLQNLESGYLDIKRYFNKYKVGILHGKMKSADKESVMSDFKEKKFDILVSTTVIEVGVDVPNASIMVIQNAERFGLSQLHQLRGRVGRGAEKSYCYLITKKEIMALTKQRIQYMVNSNDGFYLAEKDMQLRGAGNIEGTKQSGRIDFKISNLSTDSAILEEAKKRSKTILESDPYLNNQNNAKILAKINFLFPTQLRWSQIG